MEGRTGGALQIMPMGRGLLCMIGKCTDSVATCAAQCVALRGVQHTTTSVDLQQSGCSQVALGPMLMLSQGANATLRACASRM
jgi:hypothetical protein